METKQISVSAPVLNFRKMRQDFPPTTLKVGKSLYEKSGCTQTKIISYKGDIIIVEAQIVGQYQDMHSCSVEISKADSSISYSTCDCSQGVDCGHIACLLFHLEEHFNTMLLSFLGQLRGNLKGKEIGEVEKKLQEKAAKDQEKELIGDYSKAGEWLARTSLFRSNEEPLDSAELMLIIGQLNSFNGKYTEVQLAVRLVGRAKPVLIQQPKAFLFSLQQKEPLVLGSQRACLSDRSFGEGVARVIDFVRGTFEFFDKQDRISKGSFLQQPALFSLLSMAASMIKNESDNRLVVYLGSTEKQMKVAKVSLKPSFSIEVLEEKKLLIKPYFEIDSKKIPLNEVRIILASPPGILLDDTYFMLDSAYDLRQANELMDIDRYMIPQPLFPSFAAYVIPALGKMGVLEMNNGVQAILPQITRGEIRVLCTADMRDGELNVGLAFKYGNAIVPEIRRGHTLEQIKSLTIKGKSIPRDLVQEQRLAQELIWGFLPDEKEGNYTTKSEKRILEFVSETLPSFKHCVEWKFTEPMRRCFIFDSSSIVLSFSETDRPDYVNVQIKTEGPLKEIGVARVLEAAKLRRSYVETVSFEQSIFPKKLIVSSQAEIEALGTIIEDFSIPHFSGAAWKIPLWSIIGLEEGPTSSSQVSFKCTKGLKKLLASLNVVEEEVPVELPDHLVTRLHPYQKTGVSWLKRLRGFGLGGILADDMGLGKTVQAICALYEVRADQVGRPSMIVCPTSLVDNWKEEINRFEPSLKVATYVGTPGERRRLFAQNPDVDVIVTSYGLIQRDLESLEKMDLSYLILDEAQAIKNKETRSARSVKKLKSQHRLVLTGTPIENSLEDLWSLFDFLMPGFLGSHDRFMQTYVRQSAKGEMSPQEVLKKRIAPFVLRRMKQDVLDDLPPITHLTYHCYLHDEQRAFYQAAAKKAKEELISLVEKQGFEKTRLHVLATLTKLKQICCHPLLIEGSSTVPSAKYEMLQELLSGLIESGHKTVLFSQYTRMLAIIKDDLEIQKIPYLYLDGSTKNRLQLVKRFNEDGTIPVFLISLKAGGNGLNLVGADSVIHYDMWWNPAVENQATDRVWRMGQKTKVTSYKLISKGTIEEKIVEMQERKRDIISGLVESDEDMLSKLAWEDVLAILKS
jgi:superfamily II DNA or RNA helicase